MISICIPSTLKLKKYFAPKKQGITKFSSVKRDLKKKWLKLVAYQMVAQFVHSGIAYPKVNMKLEDWDICLKYEVMIADCTIIVKQAI